MKARLKKAKGPNTHSTWWCYIVAVLLILIYLLPIYIMLNLCCACISTHLMNSLIYIM